MLFFVLNPNIYINLSGIIKYFNFILVSVVWKKGENTGAIYQW